MFISIYTKCLLVYTPIAKVLDVVKLQALYVVRKLGDLSVGSKLTLIRGFSSVGRAIALQAIGHRFDPGNLHQTKCGRSSVVEPFVANETVVSSNLIARSIILRD